MSIRVTWSDAPTVGITTDGYRVEIGAGTVPGKHYLRISAPGGASLYQICASVGAAKINAETEIDNHRRRGVWTK